MLTAREILPRGTWSEGDACDRVVLDHDERHRRRFHYVAQGGTGFLLDLARATVLRDGDGLRLADGRIIAVRAAPEPLMEARAQSPHALLRLAWHIGNRHLPAEITPEGIRLRQDHVIRAMLEGLGAEVRDIDAPFSPEQGAYAGDGEPHGHEHEHGHHHGHDHDHDHAHGHHRHAG
ncbi:urease accessory protein UreE [Novosphingobium album (ex Liu et al. 2023)]|uniref:Urease accessory protein UreE n=1 Tax=Novosphingobium album (ex Liu et al. 2023) TaxID=3031130 RepID=A0ABT5WUP8_9SPHN|nr:urease accessory protein UreE [Novosphingobium album (ex Liu et al. 2023)]MDE8653599.1 urease accessory protein UreE [Novosphingobium album (ex Liu et al. 2023)]